MNTEQLAPSIHDGTGNDARSQEENEGPAMSSVSYEDKDGSAAICRVCQCAESDKKGDAILRYLGIIEEPLGNGAAGLVGQSRSRDVARLEAPEVSKGNCEGEPRRVEFITPNGEVFVCHTEPEMGPFLHHRQLIELGCSCKNDLSLVHYSCALKWFVNHGSTICEICGGVAKNISPADIHKVVVSLNDYDSLSETTAFGDPNPARLRTGGSAVGPDAISADRWQRLCEISSWFGSRANNSCYNPAVGPPAASRQP